MKKDDKEGNFIAGSASWMLGRQEDEVSFDEMELIDKLGNRTYLVLVIYDIVDNKNRCRMSRELQGYGVRVQRSAFECHITQKQYEELISKIVPVIDGECDLLRIYKLTGNTQIKTWGIVPPTEDEDLIII